MTWLVLFLVVTASITYVFARPPAWAQMLQLAHLGAGVLATVVGAVYLAVHIRQTLGEVGGGRTRLSRWLLRFGLVLVLLVIAALFIPDSAREWLNNTIVVVGFAFATTLMVTMVQTMRRSASVVALGRIFALVAFVLASSGIGVAVGFDLYGASGTPYEVHVLMAIVVIPLGVAHIVQARRRTAAGQAAPPRVYPWRRPLLFTAVPCLGGLALLAWGLTSEYSGPRPKIAEGAAPILPVTAGALAHIPDGCQGCHGEVNTQWARSAHHFAAANPLFSRLLEQVDGDQGARGTRLCLSCHAPHAPDPAGLPLSEVMASEGFAAGVHCLSCHRTRPGPLGRDGDLEMHPLADDTFAFITDLTAGHDVSHAYPTTTSLITSRIDAHREQFGFASREPESCQPCHVQSLSPHTEGRLDTVLQDQYDSWHRSSYRTQNLDCKACHARRYPDKEGYPVVDHRFLGASTYLARLAGGDAQLAETVAHLEGRDPFPPGAEIRAEGTGLLTLSVKREGARLVIDTANGGRIGHSFPNGPTDLFQIWLSLDVRTEDGRSLLNIGADGPDLKTPRLGHVLRAQSGRVIRDHRLHQVARVQDLGHIPPDEPHRVTVPLPAGGTGNSLVVDARWLYRRVDPEFLSSLTGETEPLPAVVVGRWSGTVGRDGEAGHR